MTASYIALDWGSTNLRAFLYQQGECTAEVRSERGITRLEGTTPQQVFNDVIAPWQSLNLPVIMAGMIGSNAGWVDVPYLAAPFSLDALGQHLYPVHAALPVKAWIVPGISVSRDDNCNVMRGEETQLLGAVHDSPASVYLMPGTHSKWVETDGSQVLDFRTAMTGELHYLLMNHSLIGKGLPAQQPAADVFLQGLSKGFSQPDITGRLFEVRAAHVLNRLDKSAVSDWLSGLLIGSEVAQMLRLFGHHHSVTLIGNPQLTERYAQALRLAGVSWQAFDGDQAFQSGIRRIVNAMDN
ncbi:2-dehydro-3-deoxygalactonokinase [Rouxiella chamberiensis]|jgi:2-dehydro-3-deoxygalactonokinase|uniref:2-dehydro-3-deoxygalactonokinase n=1 Tax=Rahnella sp. ChDrAdgB13 TaxID=1850581 RepID=UPI001265DB58|nr:2-dehydro-3-deoxygalactonokinase [Rahnella sp. ChDrAdgB13]KAB8312073.1 2-dehydro-3-deoxygalactonokinase [Rouxiella chamberiensis]